MTSFLLLLGLSLIAAYLLWHLYCSSSAEHRGPYLCTNVVDGDTIDVVPCYLSGQVDYDASERVRLLGIDAPEASDSEKFRRDIRRTGETAREHLARGAVSAERLREMVEGRRIELQIGKRRRGHYGRLLARVWIIDSDGKRLFEAGAQMVRDGHAVPD